LPGWPENKYLLKKGCQLSNQFDECKGGKSRSIFGDYPLRRIYLEQGIMVNCIILNGANLTGLGAKAILIGMIPALLEEMNDTEFVVLLPDQEPFTTMAYRENAQVFFVKRRNGWANSLDRLKQLFIDIPLLAKRKNATLIFSLGDLSPAHSPCPRIAYVHQPLLVYEDNELGGMRSWSYFLKFFQLNYFRMISQQQDFIVQTDVMKERLVQKFKIDRGRIDIISQAIPLHITRNLARPDRLPAIDNCRKPIRLLFLSAYYPHKNHAILPAVAAELRQQNMADQVQIFTTLDVGQHASDEIRREISNNADVITNLGQLSEGTVASALRSSTALFLPTLVESCSNTYLEAMSFAIPILTSDRDFAHWVCDDLALFFDPLSPASIVDSIKRLASISGNNKEYQIATNAWLTKFPKDNSEEAKKIAVVINRIMEKNDSYS
jgi:glycosyltransferase involved in cell wall biosynthesis